MEEAENALLQCEHDKVNEEAKLQYLATQYENIKDWAKVFDDASTDEKKMILSRIIERIDVDRNYHLTIHFFVTTEDFEMRDRKQNATVVESQNCMSAKIG